MMPPLTPLKGLEICCLRFYNDAAPTALAAAQ